MFPYDSRPWKVFGEGPIADSDIALNAQGFNEGAYGVATSEEIRFTQKGNNLYAVALAWPEDGMIVIKSLSESSRLLNGKINT